MSQEKTTREGSLEAPTRHALDWQSPDFYNEESLNKELERVFDICHGCRRCVNLCQSFPTLFDLVDESDTMEVDGVDKADYKKVVDQCYLCDLCYMTKCPYVPPHEWNVDFPHLMLRAKAAHFKNHGASFRDKVLTSTDAVGKMSTIPVINTVVNTMNENAGFRKILQSQLGVHEDAVVPKYYSPTMRQRLKNTKASGQTDAKVALFSTCYGNYNSPHLGEDLVKVFQHNNIDVELVPSECCCGMPKLELGDLETVKQHKEYNIPIMARLADQGYKITALVPSCVLMFKQELPLMFPDDPEVKKVQEAFVDPFEYLFMQYRAGVLKLDFKESLGDISYHVACHLRVQNIGLKARDILSLIPDTNIHPQERCSGHDGTYAVKVESHEKAVKIGRPVARKVDQLKSPHFASDCPMAANHIAHISESVSEARHPISLLRQAYGL
ncbi:Fe-S oxidoreductase [Hahella sp. CCB-MM4]|uniref:heterodisulfide reductase-related iron-sulfur binding cluster n=1 Tax=Hahella sp. (strain CCB-MM4) TaxID=1926491 RepID=UPI000B9A9D14|nr:heterodisulfide reductase-related iron-sulfur binding cluster [Hahella sp. CCB-MM4]OZG72811.1 Fe-S oxidoreductase [Hahella sp. CCB-MM4]